MRRRAVIDHLRNTVGSLGGRVYQAFLAPPNVKKPYATVKMASERGDPGIGFAGVTILEVFIYNDAGNFLDLDIIEKEVIAALCSTSILDQESGNQFDLQWLPGAGDFADPDKGLIGRKVSFETALLRYI